MLGQTVQHYRILSELGRGGMGIVYAAEDTRLNRRVALKFLHRDEGGLESQRRLAREARAAAQLQHPNICPVYGFEEYEGGAFLVLAYIDGRPLSRWIAGGELSYPQVLAVTKQVAGALDAAHRAGIVHRDIKPGNILVTAELHAYVLDFGLASQQTQSTSSLDEKFGGTPAYVAPEQAQGHSTGAAADQYSLAVTVFEMLTGRLPFRGGRAAELLYRVVHEAPDDLEPARCEVPPESAAAIQRALSKAPKDRFATAGEFAAALGGARVEDDQDTHTLARTGAGLSAASLSRRTLPWMGLAAAAAGAAYWRWGGSAAPRPPLRIAILPLQVSGDDPQLRALAEGFTETLTAQLTQVEDVSERVSVVPASEVLTSKVSSASQARQLYNVQLALGGSAQKRGERKVFNLLLIDAEKLVQQASRTLEFGSGNAVELQDAMIPAALRLLQIALPATQAASSAEGGTRSSAAYAAYLEGRGYLVRYDQKGNLEKARALLERAVEEDPNYALARTALAAVYTRTAKDAGDPQGRERAVAAAREAVRLAPQLVAAHTRLGETLAEFGKAGEAEAELRRALTLSPTNGEAHRALANLLGLEGRDGEAQAAFEEALRRRPADWLLHTDLGNFFLLRNRLEEAERSYRRAIDLTPDNYIVLRLLGNTLRRQSRNREAAEVFRASLQFQEHANTYNSLGLALYYQRRFPEAAEAIGKALRLSPKNYRLYGNLGTVERHLPGQRETGLAHLREALAMARETVRLRQGDNNTYANMAEYAAKLGDREAAMEAVGRIPAAVRRLYGERLGLAYELSGQRAAAIAILAESQARAATIESEPDFDELTRDPSWKRALAAAPKEKP